MSDPESSEYSRGYRDGSKNSAKPSRIPSTVLFVVFSFASLLGWDKHEDTAMLEAQEQGVTQMQAGYITEIKDLTDEAFKEEAAHIADERVLNTQRDTLINKIWPTTRRYEGTTQAFPSDQGDNR